MVAVGQQRSTRLRVCVGSNSMNRVLVELLVLGVLARCGAGDWPQYRCDAARGGYTGDPIPARLSLRWVYMPSAAPQPAWKGEDTRMPFDYAYHTVIGHGLVFFGSSADGKVHALDAATGQQRWSFFTDGPVRFAPAIWGDRVFAAGDDGYLYCLEAKTGQLYGRAEVKGHSS